jgi:bacillithiol biosynthesis deacetylase BshB1
MKLDILAFGAHPDDVELSASGTLISHIRKGFKCGIVDLTRGELGTRGNAEIREQEARRASEIIGIHARECLNMDDGFFQNDKFNQLAVVSMIRKYQPDIILSNAIMDRHPDHSRASALVSIAVFLSGLIRIKTSINNKEQERWQTKAHYHYIQDRYIKPDLVVDITEVWEKKMESVLAFSSQFYNPDSKEPGTAISGKDFLNFLEARAIESGRQIGVMYGEGFTAERFVGVKSLKDLL